MKLLILDIDGILTDGKKFYTDKGLTLCKQYNDKDFTAIKRFLALGINVCFLSGDIWNKAMADMRNIKFYSGRKKGGNLSKLQILDIILSDYNVTKEDTIYVGDDIFDIEVLQVVKEGFCPNDSPSDVKKVCTVINRKGGDGVVSELFDILLERKEIENSDINIVKKIDKKELSSKIMF
uniref:3-deoxy-D-manno-octulosonate 8-phosphate phosphatase n=1 Tax=viral metagenome TaxID=1070528 RepID=A0A6C0LWS1_9ZZZZ